MFRVYVLYERSLTVLIVLAVITIGAQVQSIVRPPSSLVRVLCSCLGHCQWSLSLAVGVATNDILQTGLPDDTISVCVFTTRLDSQLQLFSRYVHRDLTSKFITDMCAEFRSRYPKK